MLAPLLAHRIGHVAWRMSRRTLSSGQAIDMPDFDAVVDRRYRGARKWDRYASSNSLGELVYDKQVLPMWVADMEIKAPDAVLDALRTEVDHGLFGYVNVKPQLKDSVASYFLRRHQTVIDTDRFELLPGLGVGLSIIGRMAAAAGEAALVPTPVYPPFMSCIRHAGTELYTTPLKMVNGKWTFDFDHMREEVLRAEKGGRRIGWFMLCNPHNPVGRVFTRAEIEELAQFCEKYDLKVSSDEVHCDLILDPELQHVAYTTVSSGPCVTLNSPSKAYNVAGLCTAFGIPSSDELHSAMRRQMVGMMPEPNVLGVAAMEACYTSGEPWLESLLVYLRHSRDLLQDALLDEGIIESHIEGTYLAWINGEKLYERAASQGILSSKNTADLSMGRTVLNDFKLGFNDGAAFGPDGKQYKEYVRLNFGCSQIVVKEAIKRLQTGVITEVPLSAS